MTDGGGRRLLEGIYSNIRAMRNRRNRPTQSFTSRELHEALRKGMYEVFALIAGVDLEQDGAASPSLHYLDYLGTLQVLPFVVHGHAQNFLLSLLDKEYKPGMGEAELLEIVRSCRAELVERFLVKPGKFMVKVVDKQGTRIVEL